MKKLYSIFTLIVFVFSQFFPFFSVYAVSDITTFALNWNSSDLAINPGDSFAVRVDAKNNYWVDLKNAFINIDFNWKNAYFTYDGTNHRTRINSTVVTNPVPSSAYNNTTWFRFEITDSVNPTVLAWQVPNLNPISVTSWWFKVLDNISTYLNTITTWWDAKKVSDDSTVTWTPLSRVIYVNVKPHIIDYYFEKADWSQTTNQVQWSNGEPINLVLKVKDYNLCSNIAGWSVKADLSQLWLSTTESLSYVSCDIDGKTATFKKTWITTDVAIWTYTFTYSKFTAIDIDWNQNDPYDTRFWYTNLVSWNDKITDLSLSVVAASAPTMTLLSLNNEKIWWPSKLTYTLSFSGSQTWSGKISIWSDWSCNWWTTLYDWFDYTPANIQIDKVINSSSLVSGNNTLYVCLKNSWWNIWSLNLNLVKDTTSPTVWNVFITPSSIVLDNSSVKYDCSENWIYEVRIWWTWNYDWTFVSSWTAVATTQYTTTLPNALFPTYWTHNVYTYCKDDASNFAYKVWVVTKIQPTPDMWAINSFLDSDIDYNWLDWRDLSVTWDNSSFASYTDFWHYRIYLLPSNVTFDSSTQTYIKALFDKTLSSWTWDSAITKDSLNQTLASGGSYKVCMVWVSTANLLWNSACSSATTLTSDVVQNAKILSAKFTSDTNLELTTDATMDTILSTHSGWLISYVYGGNTIYSTSVASVNGTKINLTIPSLANLWAVGWTLIAQTWALHSAWWWYNNYFSSGSLIITDGQSPTITWYSNTTVSVYNGFFSWSINVWFTFAEQMKASGYTKITFDRTAWNASTQKIFSIVDPAKLTSWAKTQAVTLSWLLVSGTTYDMKLIWEDLAGNTVTSSAVSVKFDNVWPVASVLTDAPNTSSTTPTLSWIAPSDDSWNWSWVKDYTIKVYSTSDCSWSAIQTLNSTTTSKATNALTNWTYSWNVIANDNMWNIWTVSNCDSFIVDTTIPTISNGKITDTTITSTSFAKTWDTVEITADLTNTDITKIKADLSVLTWDASHTWVVCSAPVSGVSCSYTSGQVTYSFIVWFAWIVQELVRQANLIVSTLSDVTTVTKLISITVDNTSPTIWTISTPTNTTYGWISLNVAWSWISDVNLDYIKIEYSSDGWTNYNLVHTWANSSPYTWDISALTTWVNYKVRITAFDKSGNQSQTLSQIFSLDKSNPTVSVWTILTPISWEYIKWNWNYTITWNTAWVTDNQAFPANPITLEYSTDNWTNWVVISNSLPNTWSYVWNMWNINSTQVKLRMKAIDNVWNYSTYETTSYNFVIDSSNPTFSITTWTPPHGAYINANWFDAIATAWDNIKIDKIYYSFKKNLDNTYLSGTSYTWVLTWNLLQDNVNSTTYNLNSLLTPSIVNGETYDIIFRTVDKAWNEISSTARQYTADTINPSLNITNTSWNYFSGSLNITWTSSDALSGISSVKISIQKWTEYWDGSSWVSSEQLLTTSTSNSYANWSYAFNAPWTDTDWQSYTITVYAYDKSYKVNNSTSSSITAILDKTWPVIASDVWTVTPSGFYAWWTNFPLTWNTSKITTTWAWFSNIKLEYNNGWTFTTIANNLPNTWSYNSFTLPSIDGNITVIISAYDAVWNVSNSVATDSITIDSTPPQIQDLETMDMDTDGQIDALKVTMTENIKDSTINLSDFNISWVWTPTSWETWNSVNDWIFILKFADTWDTWTAPTLSYTSWSLTDLAWKFLVSVSNVVSIDKASPRILTTEIFANTSWIFNKIEVNFSENISSTTDLTAFTLNNGLSISSVSVSGNKATLNLNLWSVWTDASWYTIDFTSNANWKDSVNNVAWSLWSTVSLTDKAVPVLTSAIIKDSNNDYIADKLELNFSESLVWAISGWALSSWILSNPVSVADKITYDVSWIVWTSPSVTTDYVPWVLADSSGNNLSSISTHSVSETISPKLTSSTTLDQDGNGKIDWVLMNFSENLWSNFADFTTLVNGYTLASNPYSLNSATSVQVLLQEKSTYDTDTTPNVSISSNTSLKDTNWNSILSSQSVTWTDSVWPVIVWARYEPSTHKVFVSFSESVNLADFITSNFVLQNAWSYTISWVNTWESSITLSGEIIDYATSTISFASNSIRDTLWNKQTLTHYVSITAPIIINEIMVSSDTNNNYIELYNLSSSSVSLNWWTIAWVTLPNVSISANWYYLISKTNIATSIINVAPDLVDANLNISWTQVILNNWTIDIDKASLTTWLWDSALPAAIERKSPVANGLLASSWYKSLTSVWFDNTTPLWTPGSVNVFDTTLPTVSANMTSDMLLPLGYYSLKYTYSDNISINSSSVTFNMQKWNWSSFVDTTWYTTWTIDNNNANFNISGITYWRYKAIFSIADNAWNISTDTKEFYIDNFSFSISTPNIDLWVLEAGTLKYATNTVDVTVQTIWAWFNLVHDYAANNLWDWNWSLGYWACEGIACSTLENYKNKTFVTQAWELQTSWNLKTYTYQIKYWALVDSLKAAWIYNINNEYKVNVLY